MKKSIFETFIILLVVTGGSVFGQPRIHRDDLLARSRTVITPLDSGYFRFQYVLQSDSISAQSMVSIAIELNDEWTEYGGSVRNAVPPTEKDWGVFPHVGEKFRWFAQYDTTGIDILELAPHSAILPAESLSFSFEAKGLPGIGQFWAEGWAPWLFTQDEIDSLLDEGYPESDLHATDENFFKGLAVVRRTPSTPFTALTFLDTIKSYINQSRTLGWITNDPTANKYKRLIDTARAHLQANNRGVTKAKLDSVLLNANADSASTLSSEAYALLRFNTEYVMKKLRAEDEALDKKRK